MSFTEFWKEFYIKYIAYGDYQRELTNNLPTTYGVGTKYHFILSGMMLIFIVWFCFRTRHNSYNELYKKQKKISAFMLIVELLRMVYMLIYRPEVYAWRFDYCNQVCLFMPILILCGFKASFPFLMAVAFWGGTGVMLYPLWVFRDYGGFHLITVQSMISHGLMVLSSLNLARLHKVDIHTDFRTATFGFLCMATISFAMGAIRNENYMALFDPKGLPVLKYLSYPWHIPFVLGIIILGIFLILLLYKKLDKYILVFDLREKYKEYDANYNKEGIKNELQEPNITL